MEEYIFVKLVDCLVYKLERGSRMRKKLGNMRIEENKRERERGEVGRGGVEFKDPWHFWRS
jgi:hypothetical protein